MFAGQLPSPSVPGRQPAGIKGWTRADAIMQRSTSTAPQPLTEPARTIPARWRLNPRLRENLGSAVTFALGIRKHIMHIHRSGSAQRLPSRPKLFCACRTGHPEPETIGPFYDCFVRGMEKRAHKTCYGISQNCRLQRLARVLLTGSPRRGCLMSSRR